MTKLTQSALLFCYTESSLHAGTGSSVSAIDLPIQRERTTGYPIVQSSSVKGALRSTLTPSEQASTAEITAIFGPTTDNASEHAGAISFSDARILLFPVRSLQHTFAYVTCPHVIARLIRDAVESGSMTEAVAQGMVISDLDNNVAAVANEKAAIVIDNAAVVFEEYTFKVQRNEGIASLATWLAGHALPQIPAYKYWRDNLIHRLAVVSDSTFADFVTQSTEISTHVRLSPDTKTVASGALWTKESLPAETLLSIFVTVHRLRSKPETWPPSLNGGQASTVLKWLMEQSGKHSYFQLGGDETTGQGIVAMTWDYQAAPERNV